MTPRPFEREELLDLAADYVHDAISPADGARLETMLCSSPDARREFIAYCMLHGQIALSTAAIAPASPLEGARRGRAIVRGPASGLRRMAATVAGLTLAAAGLMFVFGLPWQALPRTAPPGSYDNRQLPLVTVANLTVDGASPQPINPSTLRPERDIALRSASGADVSLSETTVFGVTAADSGALYEGSVQARLAEPGTNFSVTTANLRIVDEGTAFRVDRIDEKHVAVTVLDGEVEVQSRVRLPVCYWPFNEVEHRGGPVGFTDVVSGLKARCGAGARPTAGLVGGGAVAFDDTAAAVVRIDGGTGDKVASGLLATPEGITVEAVILPAWSGRHLDYDEIYRKEDGDARVLLSFQNDGTKHAHFTEPAVPAGPCLSFGLHLAGRGYRELDMPLDGLDGRPTLAELTDGRPHHVVATYDSFTGRKAIFIDGRKRFEHVYPVGTLVRCGGPARAEIGNQLGVEPFHGVIDEFAIYDFGLTAEEVADHHAHVRAGRSALGAEPPVPGTPRWQAVTRLVEGQTQAFNQVTALPVGPATTPSDP